MTVDVAAHVKVIAEQGYTVIEGAFDPERADALVTDRTRKMQLAALQSP